MRNLISGPIVITLLLGGAVPIIGGAMLSNTFPDLRWAHHPFHAVAEGLGAGAALIVATLIMFMRSSGKLHATYLWIACGLIGMGVLDGFHAVLKVGESFVLTHSLATFVGGVFFTLVWLPEKISRHKHTSQLPIYVFAAFIILGSTSIIMPQLFPSMVSEGSFTDTAKGLNIIGGIGFLFAAVYLTSGHIPSTGGDKTVFATHAFLFGIAGLLFELSELWDSAWWLWHVLRLIAYMFAVYYFLKIFLDMANHLKDSHDSLKDSHDSLKDTHDNLKDSHDNLKDTHDNLKDSHDSLEINVKERTRALSESESFIRQILTAAGEGIYGIDTQGITTFVNPSACEILGYTDDELIGKRMHSMVHHSYSDRTPYLYEECPIYFTVSEGISHRVTNEVFWHKDGGSIRADYTSTPIETGGKRTGAVVTFNDITVHKKHELELARSNQELQHFAHAAAHDLQEPLRKIQAFSDRLEKKYTDVLDDKGKDYIERIVTSATRMRVLIDDLLSFSRVTSKAQPFAKTDMNILLTEVVEKLGISIEEANANLIIKPLPAIEVDRVQMYQVLYNLISNAVKFRREDAPLTITIYDANNTGKSTESLPGRNSQIIVQDTGIGFDMKFKDRIFGVFERLHGRTEYGGTGIGLATCKKIAERHGGSIIADSQPGVGSTFTLTLPTVQK